MGVDRLVFGRRLRHLRKQRGWTLDELGEKVGKPGPYLSTVETGKREPKLSLINALADALGVPPAELLDPNPPTDRAALEVELERAQAEPRYQSLRLAHLKTSAGLPDEAIRHILRLYTEMRDLTAAVPATLAEAKVANAALRGEMQQRDNYYDEIEKLARDALALIDFSGPTALPQGAITELSHHFGFGIRQVADLPPSARAIADRRNGIIYIPQRDSLKTRQARTVVAQTLAHFALEHPQPTDYTEFLRQRAEANYFAGAVLAPEEGVVPFLQEAHRRRDISVEDIKEVFYISYQMAAHRFTNLATRHLDLRVHFVRSDDEGIIWKAYENDGVPFPQAEDGTIEGQRLCRQWGTRQVFRSEDKFALHYQYTDTSAGTFWCVSHLEADREPKHAITVGAGHDDAQLFRGKETERHSVSRCPNEDCCRRPPVDLSAKWAGETWAAPRSEGPAVVPPGLFPGLDLSDVYEFLERQDPN